jgi:hypothetical protein
MEFRLARSRRVFRSSHREKPGSRPAFLRSAQFSDGSPIFAAYYLLSVIIPKLVGAYRGAKHKLFFDLAHFEKRPPNQKQEEIQDFVRMIGQE